MRSRVEQLCFKGALDAVLAWAERALYSRRHRATPGAGRLARPPRCLIRFP